MLVAIAGWFLGRWPATRWATAVAGVILLGVIAVSVFTPAKLAATVPASTATAVQGAWEPWTAEAVSRYQSQGRPVFVDFTASWCLSCQVNERLILNRADVQQRLHDSGAVLLRADWTNQDPDITQTLASLGRSGVPTYALYPADPAAPAHVLPEVLTPGIVISALNSLPNSNRQSAALARPISQ